MLSRFNDSPFEKVIDVYSGGVPIAPEIQMVQQWIVIASRPLGIHHVDGTRLRLFSLHMTFMRNTFRLEKFRVKLSVQSAVTSCKASNNAWRFHVANVIVA